MTTVNKISLDLDDLLLPYAFDLSIYHHITASDLIEHIERVGKIFYKKASVWNNYAVWNIPIFLCF